MLSGGLRTNGITKQSQENLPLITVVTVVRNGEAALEETILSVINQTYSNIEYIIVDGASTDGTLDIIRKYESRIDYWISEPDEGIYDAMNKGIDLAAGDFVNFMNAGDRFFESITLKKIINKIDDKNEVYYGDAYWYDTRQICKGKFNYFKLALTNFCHQTIFYPKIIYKSYKYLLKYRIYADWVYNLAIYRKTKFKYLDETVAIYLSGGISTIYIDKKFSKDCFYLVYKNLGMVSLICLVMYKFLIIIHKLLGSPRSKLRKMGLIK